ncbi:MAG: hypothetical protein WCA35_09980 [Kovacikia sp.]
MPFDKRHFQPSPKLAYCYCTEHTHQTILQRQQANPLPFAEAMQVHCECGDRCGRCLYPLEHLFRTEGCFLE